MHLLLLTQLHSPVVIITELKTTNSQVHLGQVNPPRSPNGVISG